MRVSQPITFNGTTPSVKIAAYDATKISCGSLIDQWNLGTGDADKFLGPMPVRLGRPFESAALSTGFSFPHVVTVSPTIDWCFLVSQAAAAATRTVVAYELNKVTAALTYLGFITMTYPAVTAHTARGLRVVRTLHTTGTVAVSGTAVTGTGTLFLTQRVGAGARIGFGSVDPTAITTWYTIVPTAAVATETGLTLVETAGTIAAGTPYVIEELRVVTATTNATTTNGGLHVTKGLHIGLFTSGGTTIAAATTIDNIRAVYWLKDAAVQTNITAAGNSLDAVGLSFTAHDCYVLDGAATTARIFRYNLRAALTLTAGAATTAFTLSTAAGTALVGNISQNNNGRIETLGHGPGSGVRCFYWVTAGRVYRAVVTNILSASTTWIADFMTEVPDGGVNTTAATATLSAIDTVTTIDRLLLTTTGAGGARSYATQYRVDGGQIDHTFLLDTKQLDQSTADAEITPHPSTNASPFATWTAGGLSFLARTAGTAALNQLYVVPLGADWGYMALSGQRAILPKKTVSASKFYRVMSNEVQTLGGLQLGKSPEPYRIVVRTSGIDDNTGAWTVVPASGDISGLSTAGSIQFAFEFKVIGDFCIPARVLNLELIYEDNASLPSQYMWSDLDSDDTGIFGFTQFQTLPSFGVHTITIKNAATGATALTQASSGTTNGSFQFHNGTAWVAGLGTNTVNTRRRFVPTGTLPAGVALYAQITVA